MMLPQKSGHTRMVVASAVVVVLIVSIAVSYAVYPLKCWECNRINGCNVIDCEGSCMNLTVVQDQYVIYEEHHCWSKEEEGCEEHIGGEHNYNLTCFCHSYGCNKGCGQSLQGILLLLPFFVNLLTMGGGPLNP